MTRLHVDGRTYVAHQRSRPLPSGRTPLVHVRGPVEWRRPFRGSWDPDVAEWVDLPDIHPMSTTGRAARFPEFMAAARDLVAEVGE